MSGYSNSSVGALKSQIFHVVALFMSVVENM